MLTRPRAKKPHPQGANQLGDYSGGGAVLRLHELRAGLRLESGQRCLSLAAAERADPAGHHQLRRECADPRHPAVRPVHPFVLTKPDSSARP
jgi:hypothetical protein